MNRVDDVDLTAGFSRSFKNVVASGSFAVDLTGG